MANTETASTISTPATTAVTQTSGILGSLTPIILMIGVFYLLIMRPQQKRESKRRELINSVKKGDKVITSGGFIGVVHKIVSEKEVSLEISENVRVRILRNSISEVLEKSSELKKEEVEEKKHDQKAKATSNSKSVPKKK